MQVILLKDVDRIGHEGDVLKVADGFARNYLIPKNLAVKAEKGTLKDLEMRRGAIEKREMEKRARAEALAADLQGKTIVVKATTGQGTKLHGTVTAQQIAAAASQQLGLDIDRRDLDIAEAIRETGNYLVSARLYKDVAAQLPVQVISDKTDKDSDEDAADEAEAAAEVTGEAEDEAEAEVESAASESEAPVAAEAEPAAAEGEAADETAE
jgi:large subunit ribosomal protein L9